MTPTATLRLIAQARVHDAEVLLANGRCDGAGYICGYAVELSLKARICDTLGWSGYPQTRGEFENFKSFKTHDLDVLLTLSGREQVIKVNHFPDWSIIATWNPETRYQAVGLITPADAHNFIESAKRLILAL